MGNYNQDNRFGSGSHGGGFRRRDSGPREMHEAVCDECGESCKVPFKPTSGKPIYCSNCFEKRDGGSSREGTARWTGKKDDTNKQLLEQVSSLNAKLDRILKVIESSDEKKLAKKTTSKDKKIKIKKVVKKVTSTENQEDKV